MGKSRSATLIIAFLLSTSAGTTKNLAAGGRSKDSEPLTPATALALIRQSRPFAEPNSGFMAQLELYHRMRCPTDLDAQPEYQRWLYHRAVEDSNSRGVAPEVAEIRFGDEHHTPTHESAAAEDSDGEGGGVKLSEPQETSSLTEYRCRRCRTPLATSTYTLAHTAAVGTSLQSGSRAKPSPSHSSSAPCAHLFLEPLSWMRPELEQGKLDGRFECPNSKCKTVVGRYAWQGMKCSCGAWVVPGVSLGRSRVDESMQRAGSSGVRKGPGVMI